MTTIADFHIHSRFSLATSPLMVPEFIAEYAAIKGVHVVGTGDFIHPEYLSILRKTLKEKAKGLYCLKDSKRKTLFIPTVEVCNIFKHAGRTKKIHTLIFSPSLEECGKISKSLEDLGKISSNGRPVFCIHIRELMKRVLDVCEDSFFIPAHIWTPWFSLLGAFSGFDSPDECFGEMTEHIFSLETGLSSDPEMNRRVSILDKFTLVSNSDAHSPSVIGREATAFTSIKNFDALKKMLMKKSRTDKLLYTVEFHPQEGKYFADGHRKCSLILTPEETRKYKDLCPRCGGKITKGVLNRVKALSDRKKGIGFDDVNKAKHLIPLENILSFVTGRGNKTKTVQNVYNKLIAETGSEFYILTEAQKDEIEYPAGEEIADAIINARQGNLDITPGYDGVYGKISIGTSV